MKILYDADDKNEVKQKTDEIKAQNPDAVTIIPVAIDDVMNLLGNNDEHKEYIYKDGAFVVKPDYVPTAKERADADAAAKASEASASLDKITTRVMRMSLAGGNTAALASEYQTTLAAVPDAAALKMPDYFPAWDGNKHAYKAGDRVTENDTLYKCLQDHTSQSDWAPGAAPSLWAKVLVTGNEDTPPAWEQPNSTNPYMKGDRVTYGGKVYESTIDNNVWKPDAYPQGWKVIEA